MDRQQSVASGRMVLDDATVQDFTASLRGEVLRPTDEGYDEARTIHNGMIDSRSHAAPGSQTSWRQSGSRVISSF